jgi:Uma2 family endonuclease
MALAEPAARRWTVAEYHLAADAGLFRPEERLELIEGEIYAMSPQKTPHSVAIDLTLPVLQQAFRPEHYVRVQEPLTLSDYSEPEPDLAVVPGKPRDYLAGHPHAPALVVEVAETTLAFDRRKAAIYARAGIPEYWILNLVDGVLEVYRRPSQDAGRYEDCTRYVSGDTVSPLLAPDQSVLVADLLP